MNLFQRKSVVLIVASWLALFAAETLWIWGDWRWLWPCAILYPFCRMALPSRPGAAWWHQNAGQSWSALRFFAYMFMARQLINTRVVDALGDWLWNNRQSSNVAAGLLLLILDRVLRDVRYFMKVPESDIENFIDEKGEFLPPVVLWRKVNPEKSQT